MLAIVLVACGAHVTGSLILDGEPFAPTDCRSGQASGFRGVELVDKDGRRVRIAAAPDLGPANVYYPGPHDLGPCASMRLSFGPSKINGIRSVEGSAELSCEATDRRVVGTVEFKNCH